jgi:PAS domain S-box-containing protein
VICITIIDECGHPFPIRRAGKMQYLAVMADAKHTNALSAIAEINNQFEALFNYATIGIVVTDYSGAIVNFNKYAESQFGYTKDEVMGKKVEMLIPQNLHGKHITHRKGFYHHPEPRRMGEGRDLFALKKNEVQFPVEVSLSHYTFKEETYVIAFVIDITIRKRGEAVVQQQKADLEKVTDDIRQLNAQLEQKVDDRTIMLRETLAELEKSREELNQALVSEKELSNMKYRFVTTASHEFRTPLSTILSSAYLLGKYQPGEYEEKKDRHIIRIKNAVEGMKGILEDFLSLGKLEEGKMAVNITEVEAGSFLNEMQLTLSEMEHLLKPGQSLLLHHDLKLSSVRTDTNMLKNILINLISNAIKFSEEHSIINISITLAPHIFSLAVRDKGIGIPVEDQPHLFERFFRAGNAANIQGTGLGLHIIRKYLDLLNGNIDIESESGEGSCFTLSFHQPGI